MAKNSIEAYGAAGKSNLLFFDPDTLHLVTDEASPLYDARVELPCDENMVRNIMHHGVLEPVLICKNPESGSVEVVAGRQRVKNAREANRRLKEQGCEPVMVPALVKRAAGGDLAGIMISENEIRQADTPVGRAEKMRRLIEVFGKSEDQVGTLFGVGIATVRSTLALLDCTKAVRDAVDAGTVNVTHAKQLAKLEPAEQRRRVAKLVETAATTNGHDRARKQREIVEPNGPRMRTRKEIATERDACSGDRRAALDWVLGL